MVAKPKSKKVLVVYKAGTVGSGNYAHAGRPGKIGGSVGKGGASASLTPMQQAKRERFNAGERERWKAYTAAKKSGMSDTDAMAAALKARDAARIDWDKQFGGVAAYANTLSTGAAPAAAVAAAPAAVVAPPKPKFVDNLYADMDFNAAGVTAEMIYDASSPEIQALASRTGLIATNKVTKDYIEQLEKDNYLTDTSSYSNQPGKPDIVEAQQSFDRYIKDNTQRYGFGGNSYKIDAAHQDPSNVTYYTQADITLASEWAKTDALANIQNNPKLLDDWAKSEGFANYQDAVDAVKGPRGARYTVRNAINNNDVGSYAYSYRNSQANLLNSVTKSMAEQDAVGSFDNLAATDKIKPLIDGYRQTKKEFADKISQITGTQYKPEPDVTYMAWETDLSNMRDMYMMAAREGKWPAFSGGAVTRWQRMSKDQKAEVQQFVKDMDGMTVDEITAKHLDFCQKRPQLYTSKYERFYADGNDASWNSHSSTYSVNDGQVQNLRNNLDKAYGGTATVGKLNDVANQAGSLFKEYDYKNQGLSFDGMAMAKHLDKNPDHANLVNEVAWRTSALTSINEKLNSLTYSSYSSLSALKGQIASVTYTDIDWDKAADFSLLSNSYMSQGKEIVIDRAKAAMNLPASPKKGDKTIHAALLDRDSESLQYFRDQIAKRWDSSAHGTFSAEINHVFKIVAPKARQDAFEASVADHDNEYSWPSYHATSYFAAASISASGFSLGRVNAGRMLGDGVYTTIQPSKAIQYLRASANGAGFSHGKDSGPVLVNRVAAGNVYEVGKTTPPKPSMTFSRGSSDYNQLPKFGYHSAYAKKGAVGLLNSEHVTFDVNGVLPKYWLDVTRK